MDKDILSLLISSLALVISLVSVVRARNAQKMATSHAEYDLSPRFSLNDMMLSIDEDKGDKTFFDYEANLVNHSDHAVKVTGIFVEYGHEKDAKRRFEHQVYGSIYVQDKEVRSIHIHGPSRLAQEISSAFNLNEVDFWVTIKIHGLYDEEVLTRYFLYRQNMSNNEISTRCPHKELAL